MVLSKCPVCKKPFDPQTSKSLPFCSTRCRQIDLGRWLDEAYSMPLENEWDEEGDQHPSQDESC